MNDYDVVVVGGRLAGAATAMLLSRAGVRVGLLDRGRYGSDTLSTHALMRAGVLQLSRWGLLDQVVAAATPPVRLTTFHCCGEEPTRISIRAHAGVDALYAPRRQLLDSILVDAAQVAGAHVSHQTSVTRLLRDGTGRVVGVRTRDGAERARDLTARFVVGADGISSRVAREVDATVIKTGRWASAVQYAYYTGLEVSGYEWAYDNGAAAGLIPTNDGLTGVFVSTSPERMRTIRLGRPPEDAFEVLFRLAAPRQQHRLAAATRVGRQHGWAGLPGYQRKPWGPGWALVGDAGYFKDPITAHGMTDALRDAELLADALLDALSSSQTDIGAEAIALDGYQRRRDSLSARLFDVTDEIAGYDWREEEIQPLLRRVSAAMTDEIELLESLPTHTPLADCGAGRHELTSAR